MKRKTAAPLSAEVPEEVALPDVESEAAPNVTQLKSARSTPGAETHPDLAARMPLKTGNPTTSASSLALDQSHMEDFATSEEEPSEVECRKPDKGVHFTVRRETGPTWKNRRLYSVLELRGRDPYIVAPGIAKQKQDAERDVLRPRLIVRCVTMAGEEFLWPLKLDPPDGKSNSFNRSALTILKIAEENWVRMETGKKSYRHRISKKTLGQTPPRFTDRTFEELIDMAFPEDRIVASLDHEIWDVLDNGSEND